MASQPQSVVAADFNNDGYPDLATANNNAANVSVRLNTSISTNLSISAPVGPVSIGSGPPGSQITAQLGTVQVLDNRTTGTHSWTATVSATSFSTAGGGATIPTSRISYWSGPLTASTGTGAFTPGQLTAANAVVLTVPRTAFSHGTSAAVNSASWNPRLIVNIPLTSVVGTYTGTITHSVA